MTDAETLLEAGLAPLDADLGGKERAADTLRARSYGHPALPGRTIVQLTGDAVAPGEDAAMAFLGFGDPAVSGPVARTRKRGLGYPAWALVNDPEHAQLALGVVKDMGRAARMGKSKPGNAEELYLSLAGKLPKNHLPAYWEQAARAMLAAGSDRLAATFFGRAREVEDVYALDVDEDARREAFLEFAFGGALTVKAIASYSAQLAKRYEPARAYAEFRELAVRRTRGGLPPWAELPAQLDKLARAAKADVKAERAAIVAELVPLPATRHAPGKVWAAWRDQVIALATDDPAFRAAVREAFPSHVPAGEWFGLLEATGALDELRLGQAGNVAAWVSAAIPFSRGGSWRTRPGIYRPLIAELPRLAGAANRQGGEVTISGFWIDAELIDALAGHGFAIGPLPERFRLDLGPALSQPEPGALAALAASPRFAPLLDKAVTELAQLDPALAVPAVRPLAIRHLQAKAAELAGSLQGAVAVLTYLQSHTGPAAREACPQLFEEAAKANVAALVARSLRAGILDEYGWPALDEAVADIGENFSVTNSWPVLTLCSSVKAIAIGPAGRIAEHDLRLPTQVATTYSSRPVAAYTGGQFFVAWFDNGAHGYWSSRPGDVIDDVSAALSDLRSYSHAPSRMAPLDADGLRVGSSGALRPGDTHAPGGHDVFFDGHTYWRRTEDWQATTLQEFDPATGKAGRSSLPAFFEDASRPAGSDIDLAASWLVPLPPEVTGSPFDGGGKIAGAVCYRQADGPGARITAAGLTTPANRSGVLAVPGAAPLEIGPAAGYAHHGAYAQGMAQWVFRMREYTTYSAPVEGDSWHAPAGTPFVPDLVYWHFFQLRDPAGSERLRHLADDEVRGWLQAAAAAIGETPQDPAELDEKAIGQVVRALAELGSKKSLLRRAQGGARFTSDRLARGVAGQLLAGIALQRRLTAFTTPADQLPGAELLDAAGQIDEGQLSGMLGDLVGTWEPGRTVRAMVAGSEFAQGRMASRAAVAELKAARRDFADLLEASGLIALRAASPASPPEGRDALLRLLRVYRETVFPSLLANSPGTLWRGCLTLRDATSLAVSSGAGCAFVAADSVWRDDGNQYTVLDVRREADKPAAAPLGPVVDLRPVVTSWGSPEQLDAVIGRIAAGPLTWQPEAVELLATSTGLTPQVAAVLLAGGYEGQWYSAAKALKSPQLRAMTGLKAAEIKAAAETVASFDPAKRRRAISAGAAALATGQMTDVAAAIAAAWVQAFGQAISVDPGVVAAATFKFPSARPAEVALARLADPAADPDLAKARVRVLDKDGRFSVRDAAVAIEDLMTGVAWCYQRLPLNHPLLARAGEAAGAVQAVIADPEVLLPLHFASLWGRDREASLEHILGQFPQVTRNKDETVQADDGLTALSASTSSYELNLGFYFRPAIPESDPRWEFARAIVGPEEVARSAALRCVQAIRSGGFAALCERIAAARAAGEDGYEADPLVAAPALVAKVSGELEVSEDAARYYLQLLALAEPTDRNVKTWNGWTPKTLAAARTGLLAAGHVIEAKRARAGRNVFVPGEWWEAGAPYLPIEEFKAADYGAYRSGRKAAGRWPAFIPMRPLGQIFEDAWARSAGR